MNEKSSKIMLYCAGGAGTNIGSQFIKHRGKENPGFASLDMCFIDTSKSNLNPNIPQDTVYILDDLDGSGKLRSSNYVALQEASNDILHHHKPTDLNVVIHSASGGSGSVIGPILVSELLNRKESVIVILIGSTSSRIETENTVKTLKSYEVISQKRSLPVIASYFENGVDAEHTRALVDQKIQTNIMVLSALFSGSNREMDMADLKNFLNYTAVTSYKPKLSYIDFFSGEIKLGKHQAIVSLATLVDEQTPSDIQSPVEYQAVGFLPEVTKSAVSVPLPIHSAVITGYYNGIIDRLDNKLASYSELRNTVVEKSIADRDIKSTDEGLVL